MARDPRATYDHLNRLAKDQAGTPEGELAAELAAQLRSKYGPEAVETPPEPVHKVRVSYSTDHDRQLAIRIGTFLGLATMRYGYTRPDGKGTRWRDQVSLEGHRDLVELAVKLYADYRRRLAELLEWTAAGYYAAAFPLPPRERTGEAAEATDAQLAAARAGMAAGRRDRHQPPVPRLTTTTPRLEG